MIYDRVSFIVWTILCPDSFLTESLNCIRLLSIQDKTMTRTY